MLYDDTGYMNFMISTLSVKGVRIVEFPSIYEASSIVPFLLINDHSIIVMRNPKKDILNLIKIIIRKGFLFFKQHSQPIKINITLWVLIDVVSLNDRNKITKKGAKTTQEVIVKEYGNDFLNLFDIAIDYSSYSNMDTLGYDFLRF